MAQPDEPDTSYQSEDSPKYLAGITLVVITVIAIAVAVVLVQGLELAQASWIHGR